MAVKRHRVKPSKLDLVSMRIHNPEQYEEYLKQHGNVRSEECRQHFQNNKIKMPGIKK